MTAGFGHNGMTRDEWLHVILRSGQVTRIAQHLAFVIYHLSDPETNQAKLSARDLESITGWGRTAIMEHIDELEIYVRVAWGQGRAKALFELQGVIAEAVRPLRSVREADTTADTRTEFTENSRQTATTERRQTATNLVVSQVATTADTRTATTVCGGPDGHKNDDQLAFVSARRPQNQFGGGKGGVLGESSISTSLSQGAPPRNDAGATLRPWIVHPDGSFSGTAFDTFTPTEIAGFRSAFSFLEFPAELIAADQFLAAQFELDRSPPEFGSQSRLARLHTYLAKRNREASAAIEAARDAMRSKAEVANGDCWFAEDRLMVANGFKADLMAEVGNDERRLRRTLDKVAASVPIDLKGSALKKVVRGQFARQIDWGEQDERKTIAVEKRASPRTASVSPDGKLETEKERLLRMLGS